MMDEGYRLEVNPLGQLTSEKFQLSISINPPTFSEVNRLCWNNFQIEVD